MSKLLIIRWLFMYSSLDFLDFIFSVSLEKGYRQIKGLGDIFRHCSAPEVARLELLHPILHGELTHPSHQREKVR